MLKEYLEGSWSDRLRILRAAKKMDQQEVAENIGVFKKTYQRWEKGESEPYPDNKRKLCELFGRDDIFTASEPQKGVDENCHS